ncbi:MAG: metal-dependent transcriptional regulator [Flavobacteriaceae bacterium]|nr:metal-dependent transcriptional regulator [Flavobacteriaceae bacterium]
MFSPSEENYLKAIYALQCDQGSPISTNLISEKICTKASSVTDMLKKLSAKNLVDYQKYQGVFLTDQGMKHALKVLRKHRLWEFFLVEKLNYKWEEVHVIAEQLEHINSESLVDNLDAFLGYPKFDPHGDPIPDKNGILSLSELNNLLEAGGW